MSLLHKDEPVDAWLFTADYRRFGDFLWHRPGPTPSNVVRIYCRNGCRDIRLAGHV